jgi:aspartyl-tRNA(Asn)/glutamyl-tRNA(Gln) amidotransferase subunit A
MTELHDLTANQVVDGIAGREFSSVEVVQALLRRIDRLEPELQAWAKLDPEGALAQARHCDTEVASGRKPERLAGLPLGIKDVFYTAGLETVANSPLLLGHVPTEDAGAVAVLRADGAVVLGKTVTTQFADGDPAITRNPWNADRTPGGSSSGSAAAVAARMVPAALGTQTAGSVLRPAGFCGVVGLKPTFGRISRRNVLPFAWSLDTMGIIARDVRDAAMVLRALATHDPLDDGSAQRPFEHYRAAANEPRAPKLGLVREYLDRSQPEVRAHLEATAARFVEQGAEVQEVRFPGDYDLALASHLTIQQVEAADLHARMHADRPDAYLPRLRAAIEVGHLVPGAAYVRAQRIRRQLRLAFGSLLSGLDALLLPTASHVAPERATTGDTTFQGVITMLGLPAISIPSGLNAERLPFATQLVAKAWDETTLLSSASWCEGLLGTLPAPC